MVIQDDTGILVAGAGGFIGGHLVARLQRDYPQATVYAVDVKPFDQWHQRFTTVKNKLADLRYADQCDRLIVEIANAHPQFIVFNLAANMGGIGFIEKHKALCMLNVQINTNLLDAIRMFALKRCVRYFFSSSACVYPAGAQGKGLDNYSLRESVAYPAMPEDGYGWEKLFSERMCRHFREDFGIPTRVARYHNIYGPHGDYNTGREKAPAAIMYKLLTADKEIELWGDGSQLRSFTYIDDCIEGTLRLTLSDCVHPLNIGSDNIIRIDELADLIRDVCKCRDVAIKWDSSKPQGVHGRCSENSAIKCILGWSPGVPLFYGIGQLYIWMKELIQCPR